MQKPKRRGQVLTPAIVFPQFLAGERGDDVARGAEQRRRHHPHFALVDLWRASTHGVFALLQMRRGGKEKYVVNDTF